MGGEERERGAEERVGLQGGWAGVRSGDEDAWKRTPRGDVLRWRQEALPHQGETQEEGLDQSIIVLIGLRDYQDAKADVILKYSADEARNLKSYGEFPESVKINETVDFVGGDLDDDIEFDDVDSEGSGSDEGD